MRTLNPETLGMQLYTTESSGDLTSSFLNTVPNYLTANGKTETRTGPRFLKKQLQVMVQRHTLPVYIALLPNSG